MLAKYPGAVATLNKYGRYEITDLRVLGSGAKEHDAWEDAARKLMKTTVKESNGRR